MTHIGVALFNYQAGGRLRSGGYDFRPLQRAFADLDTAPALILFCEAKNYASDANAGLLGAAEALSDALNAPYIGLLGESSRGPIPPAMFYDPNVLQLRRWWTPGSPDAFDDQRNVATFAVRTTQRLHPPRREFIAWVNHWDFRSGVTRLLEAKNIDRYGRDPRPAIGGGDLNACGSGPLLAPPEWTAIEPRLRSHKGIRLADGTWTLDTAAVDHLIGRWTAAGDHIQDGYRVDGQGFHAVAELAWRNGMPAGQAFLPTTNPPSKSLLTDWLLINEAMLPYLVADSYRVHIPDGPPYPSDHRLVTAAVDL